MSYSVVLPPVATDMGFVDHWEWPAMPTFNKRKGNDATGSQPRYNVVDFLSQQQIKQKFNELAQRWDEETIDLSSLTEILSHESYLAIIALGRPVLPLLFSELEKHPNYWFTAISSILRANDEYSDVVDEADYGNLQKMTDAWLEWGKEHSYLD